MNQKEKLTLFNTINRQKEIFKPINTNKVKLYVCGVTVYDYCHIGHARAYVFFDTLHRVLKNQGYEVTYIQNFTDIDDKIINKANEKNTDFMSITKTYTDAYFEDMDQLNILRATQYPKATGYIPQMISLIETLISKGHAYISAGDVCFSTNSYKSYGELSKKVLDELEPGKRIEVEDNKHHPLDFVLWKKAKPNEPFWDSPWGKGRPGWHIECSAMAKELLGDTIDIHGGGEDLIFPHHENERAQSECCTQQPLANYWLHNGFVTIKDEKMSKSKKNFVTIRKILETYPGEVIRFFLMKTHYRKLLNYTVAGLNEARQAYNRLTSTLKNSEENQTILEKHRMVFQGLENEFLSALSDDINTSEAIGILFKMNKKVNELKAGSSYLKKCGTIIGLFENIPIEEEIADEIEVLIDKRNQAKKNRDFATADSIRDQLLNDHNIVLEDTAGGTRWKKSC